MLLRLRGLRRVGAVAVLALLASAASAQEEHCIAPAALSDIGAQIRDTLRSDIDDKRFVLPRERGDFRAFDHVGAVSIKDKFTRQRWLKSGSGTLISACYVLTSYHVVFPDFADFTQARKVTFSFGVSERSDKPFKYSIEGVPVDIGLFDPQRPIYAIDQVLIRLNQPAPPEYQPMDFVDVASKDFGDAEVYACGYPGDINSIFEGEPQALYCDKCQVKGYNYLRGYETNCTMLAGTSGGGVFRVLKDATCDPRLKVALVGAPNQSPDGAVFPKNHPRIRSFVTDFNKTLSAIKRIVDHDNCAPRLEPQAQGISPRGYR